MMMSKPKKVGDGNAQNQKKSLQKYFEHLKEQHASRQLSSAELCSQVGEFLDCFIIIGYDVNNNPVKIIYSHNEKENAALSHLIIDFVENNNQSEE